MGWDFDDIEEFPEIFEDDEELMKFLEKADIELIEDNMNFLFKRKKEKNETRARSKRSTRRLSNTTSKV